MLVLLCSMTTISTAEEAQWIWATGTTADQPIAENAVCLFRKTINLKVPATGRIEIAADDQYELFVNGKQIGTGSSSRQVDELDITDYLEVGRNVVAVRVLNTHGDTAALMARVSVKPGNSDKWYTFNSDASWKTNPEDIPLWATVVFNDRLWGSAAMFGALGDTAPWDRDEEVVAEQQTEQSERFQIQKGFGVQRVLADEKIGSVIAMTFNEFGHMLLSQEGGPLLLVYDQNEDGIPETVRTYCDKVKSCQGILALNGEVFVTGDGPEGVALYRLSDTDRNGSLEKATAILKFKGDGGEHGPHGLRLGHDGMIYVALGSHVRSIGKRGDGETYRDPYEGDVLPRYEDPSGHGRGVKAPGGTIIRTNVDGSVVETVAGGLRNAYDIVFHPSGGMFIHDSDMENDIGTAWYRPNAIFDVTEGAEFGWRSGWSKWPEYYLDRLPDLLDTGRGSPTGGVCYEHYMFPVRYQNTLFMADWSEGRILNVRLKPRGAGYVADSEVFLQGQPLNVTDLEVGPDGALYFCTGGRATAGGVYRVVYKGKIPDRVKNLGSGIASAVRQPQIESAWTRQEIASIKRELGDKWNQMVAGVAYSDDNPPEYRVRAMTLMQLFGPVPSEDLLLELSKAESEQVRAKAATMLGMGSGARSRERLVELLADDDPHVKRAACESMIRGELLPTDTEALMPLLGSEDRTLAFVARRVLERMPVSRWRKEVLNTADARVAIVGMLALVNAEPTEATAIEVLERVSEMMTGFLSDADFTDVLRLTQVAISRGKVDASKLQPLGEQIAEEFPAGEQRINHELIRLAAYLGSDSLATRAIDYLDSDAPEDSRTLVAMCLQFLSHDWNAQQRFAILKYYEKAANRSSDGSLPLYMTNVTRDFADSLSEDDLNAILEQGHVWQNAALAAIYKLERPISDDTAESLISLDEKLRADDRETRDAQRRLRTGIVALLATSETEESGEYLRLLWREEPERRAVIAMALSVHPEGDNWDYLVRSLNILEDVAADEVVKALRTVPIATDDPTALRHLILLGVRAEEQQLPFENVERLLEHWTGMERPDGGQKSMRPWQKWFSKTYPDRPAAVPPKPDESRWDFEQLVSHLESDEGRFGDPELGKVAYTKAQCAQCHRFGNYGESIGPNLSGIARRFTRREIVESILYPAHVVSDQYASKKVLTLDGRVFVGMVSDDSGGTMTIRDAKNTTTVIASKDIDQILPSTSSIMPSGLVDELTLKEIGDLMAYLGALPSAQVAQRPEE
ncbi:DUF7133 domain-containing protein [Stieleria varia]|uniref:Cryptic beta-D-galactosidase subunit alpha n=1 Tax=Stieleria varia TaxID=2528005 RepID=A0A5C6ASJ0_9BACT|nr:HEAT repeat domain-containing protein [Stieleria varia]TWU02955.1 cryptic beta-D-galactosidase subunit alpha [Stieleria varia]